MDDKSKEIIAIPQLLQMPEISGCIVTVDAMGCQTSIAQAILAKEGEYVLALKENQGRLFEDFQLLFGALGKSEYKAYSWDYHKTVNQEHGRIETREC